MALPATPSTSVDRVHIHYEDKHYSIDSVLELFPSNFRGKNATMQMRERLVEYMNLVNNNINPDSIVKYGKDTVLSKFVCPISKIVTLLPTRTSNGYLFDLECLLRIPKDQRGQTLCPMGGESFNVEQLSLDSETALVINKRLLYLLQQDIAHAEKDPEIKKTLEAQATLVMAAIKTNYLNSLVMFDCRMANGVIKALECTEERAEFMSCFGDSPDREINWEEVNWNAVLDKRWLKLNPGTIVLDQ